MNGIDTNRGLEERLARMMQKFSTRGDTCSVQFALESPQRNWRWQWTETGAPKQYFIASTTKLYVVSLIMQLRQ